MEVDIIRGNMKGKCIINPKFNIIIIINILIMLMNIEVPLTCEKTI